MKWMQLLPSPSAYRHERGTRQIIRTFLGVLMFKIINNALVAVKVPTFRTGAISSAIIIIAVLLQSLRNRSK